jgi:hypothetical protein
MRRPVTPPARHRRPPGAAQSAPRSRAAAPFAERALVETSPRRADRGTVSAAPTDGARYRKPRPAGQRGARPSARRMTPIRHVTKRYTVRPYDDAEPLGAAESRAAAGRRPAQTVAMCEVRGGQPRCPARARATSRRGPHRGDR